MDTSFISKFNITSIFDSLNTVFVREHHFNLTSDAKYKKIVKKLSKAVYSSLNNNANIGNLLVHEFNNIVIEKTLPFILKEIKRKNDLSNNNTIVSSNASFDTIQTKPVTTTISSTNTTTLSDFTEPVGTTSTVNSVSNEIVDSLSKILPKKSNKKKKRRNKKMESLKILDDTPLSNSEMTLFLDETLNINNDNETYDDFLKNQISFSEQLKNANKTIKENLETLVLSKNTDSKLFSKKERHIPDFERKNMNAFETKIEETVEKDPYKSVLDNAFENYDGEKINETITRVMMNQKNYTKNNQVETYEGEKYVGNLIKPVGEAAPIQPLLYQNSSQGVERVTKKIFAIDSGGRRAAAAPDPGNVIANTILTPAGDAAVYWNKCKISFIETLKIDKLSDIYLRSVSINQPSNIRTNGAGQCFVIDIDELNIQYTSNNQNLKDKIVIPNTIENAGGAGGTITARAAGAVERTAVDYSTFNVTYPSETFYLCSVNPSKLSQLTITLTDQDGRTTAGSFFQASNQDNRIIMSFEIVTRAVRDELL